VSSPFIPIKTADVEWRDGLPFSILYDDIYFSAESGIEQSRYVFIDGNDLINRWLTLSHDNSSEFNIAETGFGTGLNFLLTWHLWDQYAPQTAKLHFISSEKHPLHLNDLIRSLSNWPELSKHAKQLIENYPILTPGYHHLSFDNGRVKLTLMLGNALDSFEQLVICGEPSLEFELRSTFIDAWYLDGFSPKKNESMWSNSLMRVIAMLSKEGTTLATYTAAASVKSIIGEVGFIVKKKKGFGQKRHMISAHFIKYSSGRLKVLHTPWHVGHPVKPPKKSAIIIGAGLAGCFIAHSLVKRGWKVTIIEELEIPGNAGSANPKTFSI
jgi:tRNA 5-methylaminomethyl-2-thiouridine biosynthesis bifunctional protein